MNFLPFLYFLKCFLRNPLGFFSANCFLTHCFNHFSLIWGATFNCILSSVCWSCKIWFCNKSLKVSIQCCHLFIFLHHISFCYYFAFIFESKSEFSNQDGQEIFGFFCWKIVPPVPRLFLHKNQQKADRFHSSLLFLEYVTNGLYSYPWREKYLGIEIQTVCAQLRRMEYL